MSPQETIIQRIRKLFAKADSAQEIGSVAEAEAFAAKANELLLAHKLDMSELELVAENAAEPVGQIIVDVVAAAGLKEKGRRRSAWLETLASVLARAHFCKILILPGSKRIFIIGRPSDRELVAYLYVTLAAAAERLALAHEHACHVQLKKYGTPLPKKPKRAFLLGFVVGIKTQLAKIRAEVERARGAMALVRFNDAHQAVENHLAVMRKNKDLTTNHGPRLNTRVGSTSSFEAGRKAGESAPLTRGVGSTNASPSLPKGGVV